MRAPPIICSRGSFQSISSLPRSGCRKFPASARPSPASSNAGSGDADDFRSAARESTKIAQDEQCLGFARYLHFPNDLARIIHNADARLLYRYVQSSKMVHAVLLLLLLEAVHPDLVFTISLKRSFSYPQTRRPITPSLDPGERKPT